MNQFPVSEYYVATSEYSLTN